MVGVSIGSVPIHWVALLPVMVAFITVMQLMCLPNYLAGYFTGR